MNRLAPYVGPVLNKVNEAVSVLGQDSQQDPVMKLQNMGNIMINVVTIAWIVISGVVFATSLVASAFPGINPAGFAFINMFLFFMPVFMAIIASLFIQGSILAVYVPMVPFIIFTFTAMGWFALIVETMVAGPIVALGMTHPEGHDLLGASQQGIILLLSVFLRPVLMVIGLVAGMLLSRIGLQYLNEGFLMITNTSSSLGIMTFFAMMYLYCALVIMVVHTSFNMIHQVPSKVMRWIGLSDQAGGEAHEALQQGRSGSQQGAQAMGDMQNKGVEASRGSGQAIGSNIQRRNSEGSTASSTDNSGGANNPSLTGGSTSPSATPGTDSGIA